MLFSKESLTYRELNSKANALAEVLRAAGIKYADVIGLMIGNSLELPIAMLAAMKIGAIFIPLDEMWPADRLSSVVRSAKPAAILSLAIRQSIADCKRMIDIDHKYLREIDGFDCAHVGRHDAVYGFPTSGSSGPPKCALNIHLGLLNRMLYMSTRYGATASHVTLQNSRHVFDSALWQLLWPLTTGGRVVIPPPSLRLDLDKTLTLIEHHAVTMTDFVPSVFNALVEYLERRPMDVARIQGLRELLIGGEEINASYCRRFHRLLPDVGLTNTYGPTEAAIGMVFHAVSPDDGDRVPIGRPIDNTHAIVLDDKLRLVPPGAIGELYIGGDCLGVGYLNDPERTRGSWIKSPYRELPGEFLYRTGDLVYQEPCGLLYFVGRRDSQVKIGGVRIELGEIERTLRRFPGINEVVVCVTDGVVGKRLLAYIVSGKELSVDSLKEYLGDRLPQQCIPSSFTFVDALPLTHNGKVDRRRLGESVKGGDGSPIEGSRSQMALADIWRQVLDTPDAGVDDDFFALGGDSLLALHLIGEIADKLGVTLKLKVIYDNPTLCQLSAVVAAGGVQREVVSERSGRLRNDLTLLDGLPNTTGSPEREPKCILMTGASGFIGTHVLCELLARSPVQILCVLRGNDVEVARQRLCVALKEYGLWRDGFEQRIGVVLGNLEAERLGVAPDSWGHLENDVDTIIHCGGVVDFLHDYDRHRQANVLGTVHLLTLAAEGKPKAIHYLSSANAQGWNNGDPPPMIEEPARGYAQSKWVAEQLAVAARAKGIDVTVYRIGEAMPHSQKGILNPTSLVNLMLSTCLVLGVYPQALVRLDYAPVDFVSRIIGDAVLEGVCRGGSVGLFHPCGTSLDWIMNVFRSLGADVEPTTGTGFTKVLKEYGVGDRWRSVYALLSVVRAAMETDSEAEMYGGTSDAALSRLFVAPADTCCGAAYGSGSDFWPLIDRDLLQPVLSGLDIARQADAEVSLRNGRSHGDHDVVPTSRYRESNLAAGV